MAKQDPLVITLALKAARPDALVRDEKAFRKAMGYGTVNEGADVDVTDANGDTAAARLAKRALAERVKYWLSEGMNGDVPVSYTITDGVMVYRARGRVTPMKESAEGLIARKWCKEHYSYLSDLYAILNLMYFGASLTSKGNDGKTVRRHLEALNHRLIDRGIAGHAMSLRKLARRIGGEKGRALKAERAARKYKKQIAARRTAATTERRAAKAKTKSKTKTKAKTKSKSKTQ